MGKAKRQEAGRREKAKSRAGVSRKSHHRLSGQTITEVRFTSGAGKAGVPGALGAPPRHPLASPRRPPCQAEPTSIES